jgi:DNA-binding MarR family transcriptional regulator
MAFRLRGLTKREDRAWRAFLRAHYQIVRKLDAVLLNEEGMSLSAFEVLRWLDQAPGGRMRMSELAGSVLLSRSGVTRLVDNLVAEGLIERQRFEGDARGSEAVLTEKGRQRLEDISRVHFDGVKEFFTGRLNESELDALADLLGKLVDPEGEGENC